MADQSISQLPVATTLTGDELTVVVQNGVTKQTQLLDITNIVVPGRLIDYLYFDEASDLIVVYTDSTTQNLGPIPGYIAAEIAPNGHLILTNSDGGTTDAGSVFASLAQTFLTVGNETSSLANSSRLVAGSNITLTQGANTLTISTSGASGSLNGAGTGIIVKDSSNTVVARTLTSSAGIGIFNADGISGNPSIFPTSKLADIQNLATTGILAVVGGTTVVDRNIVGTGSQITVTGGDGSANPTISIATNPVLPGTGSVTIPTGTTAQRPGALPGQLRFNSQLDVFEGQNSSGVWQTIALGSGVTSIGAGTGLQSDTTNPITSTGTLSISATGVTAGSYGDATNVAQIAVNAQGQITSASNVAITASGLGAITAVNGTANAISSSQVGTVVTLNLPNALTFTGKTVTGGTLTSVSIDGATNTLTNIGNSSLVNSSVTIGSSNLALGGTLTTLAGVTISGATNTLSNIGNSSLTNSSITLGTTNIALGGTSLAPAGLTSVTVTQDPTSAFQLATKQYVDTIATSGIDYHQAVKYEVPLINLNATYNNGAAGVGATLTNAGTLVAFTPDGTVASAGDRILVYNQTNAAENGVYTVTVVGDGSTAWVLTRATDADTWGVNNPNKLDQGSAFFISSGATGAGETYVCNTVGTITFGTTPITFVQISDTQIYSAGTGLGLSGTQFYIANTAVTAGSYGSAAKTLTATVNAQGQLTALADTNISIAPSQINATIPNSGLTNSSITINGTSVSLGGSVSVGTVTSLTSSTLTIGGTSAVPTVDLTSGIVTPGTTGSSTQVPVVTVDTYGRVTNITTAAIGGGTVTSVSGTGTVSGITLSGTVTTSGSLTLGGALDLSAPPAIGGTTPNAITGTTITATNYVGISGGTF